MARAVNPLYAWRSVLCAVIKQAVDDANDDRLEPAERRAARDFLIGAGLKWACSWLELDRDRFLADLVNEGLIDTTRREDATFRKNDRPGERTDQIAN